MFFSFGINLFNNNKKFVVSFVPFARSSSFLLPTVVQLECVKPVDYYSTGDGGTRRANSRPTRPHVHVSQRSVPLPGSLPWENFFDMYLKWRGVNSFVRSFLPFFRMFSLLFQVIYTHIVQRNFIEINKLIQSRT